MIAAELAIQAWVNGRANLLGDPDSLDGRGEGPVARGAYLRMQRSPADGPYLIITRTPPGGGEGPVAEPAPDLCTARITALAYAGTEDVAEVAAAAYAAAVAALSGVREECGGTGIWILGHDNLAGPAFIPPSATTGETYAFQVTADFLLADLGPHPALYDSEEQWHGI
jgi:hypothetical protein